MKLEVGFEHPLLLCTMQIFLSKGSVGLFVDMCTFFRSFSSLFFEMSFLIKCTHFCILRFYKTNDLNITFFVIGRS